MDLPEPPPSLIDYLQTPDSGFYIDLTLPWPDRAGESMRKGHFTNTLPARVVSDGGATIRRVVLVKQRDRYAAPNSVAPISNLHLEQAWQNSFQFHRSSGDQHAPMMVKHQVGPQGDLKPFRALFVCQATQKWFHPVCPQCGLPLTLCKDDALLAQRGLPTYADSLTRLMVCESCTRLSETSPMYCRQKTAGLPDRIQDKDALISQWQQLLATLPDEADLPCRACPSTQACYGPDALAHQRIQPFGFYPFFMLILPAPSMDAGNFLQAVAGGGEGEGDAPQEPGSSPSKTRWLLFQNQDRQFLEILFLKLSFLEQVACRLMPETDAAALPEFDLSLDGIGIDLYRPGIGLPAYWNFNARILDAVGSFLGSPFASGPTMPSRLLFLGALWFRTLLVNSLQQAEAVFAEVQRTINQMTDEGGLQNWSCDPSHSSGVFAPSHIAWMPNDRAIPETWHRLWEQSLRLGMKLVQAGLKTGIAWDRAAFTAELASLRDAIQTEMFSSAAASSTPSVSAPASSERIRMVLSQILQQWQAESTADRPTAHAASPPNGQATIVSAAPAESSPAQIRSNTEAYGQPPLQPENAGWDLDIEETVILKAPDEAASNDTRPQGDGAQPDQEFVGGDDDQATVVIRKDAPAAAHTTPTPHGPDDLEKTMVVSPRTQAPAVPDGDAPDDLEATLILNSGAPPTSEKPSTLEDDDLAATVVQHSDDLDATLVLNPSGQPSAKDRSPGAIDDDLVETVVQTPRSGDHPDGRPKSKQPASPPPVRPQPMGDHSRGTSAPTDADDDIMEQTVIIRSDTKKG